MDDLDDIGSAKNISPGLARLEKTLSDIMKMIDLFSMDDEWSL